MKLKLRLKSVHDKVEGGDKVSSITSMIYEWVTDEICDSFGELLGVSRLPRGYDWTYTE
jgi:hypothetical protein